jgi:ABC-type phosphate transport system substrate-binding protein
MPVIIPGLAQMVYRGCLSTPTGTTVPWPVGLAGQGNGGVAAIVKQTPYSIGFGFRSPMRREKRPIRSRASRGFLSRKNSMTKIC